ncbi:MAG: hypothetical protein V1798_02155 [Pseudomonadota bacterium]
MTFKRLKPPVLWIAGFAAGVAFVISCGSKGIDGVQVLAQIVAHAIDVAYDNAVSGLLSTTVQAAIDELAAKQKAGDNSLQTLSGTIPQRMTFEVNGSGPDSACVVKDLKDLCGGNDGCQIRYVLKEKAATKVYVFTASLFLAPYNSTQTAASYTGVNRNIHFIWGDGAITGEGNYPWIENGWEVNNVAVGEGIPDNTVCPSLTAGTDPPYTSGVELPAGQLVFRVPNNIDAFITVMK